VKNHICCFLFCLFILICAGCSEGKKQSDADVFENKGSASDFTESSKEKAEFFDPDELGKDINNWLYSHDTIAENKHGTYFIQDVAGGINKQYIEMIPLGSTANEKITIAEATYIKDMNIQGEWVYYIDADYARDEQGNYLRRICRAKNIEQEPEEILSGEDYDRLFVKGGTLWYLRTVRTSAMGGRTELVKYDMRDKSKSVIFSHDGLDSIEEYFFHDEKLYTYCVLERDYNRRVKQSILYSIDLYAENAQPNEIFISASSCDGWQIDGDIIYFNSKDPDSKTSYICTFRIDGDEISKLDECYTGIIREGVLYQVKNYKGVFCSSPSGDNLTQINSDGFQNIYLFGVSSEGYIYYSNNLGEPFYRCKTDGSNWEDIRSPF